MEIKSVSLNSASQCEYCGCGCSCHIRLTTFSAISPVFLPGESASSCNVRDPLKTGFRFPFLETNGGGINLMTFARIEVHLDSTGKTCSSTRFPVARAKPVPIRPGCRLAFTLLISTVYYGSETRVDFMLDDKDDIGELPGPSLPSEVGFFEAGPGDSMGVSLMCWHCLVPTFWHSNPHHYNPPNALRSFSKDWTSQLEFSGGMEIQSATLNSASHCEYCGCGCSCYM
jgi:hypothetical protein